MKSWLLDSRAPKVIPPEVIKEKIKNLPYNFERPLKVEGVSFDEK